MKAWRRVCKWCWRNVARGKSVCLLGDARAHAGLGGLDEPPAGFTNEVEKRPECESTADDKIAHDEEFDESKWAEGDSDDEPDELTEEQKEVGFVLIGKLVKDRLVQGK
jgi:hypothetical protein